jgi:predicted RNase H-like nuclease (RuvC/YqgF family)
MSKTRRKRATITSDSVDETKNVSEVNETPTQLKKDAPDMQDENRELDDTIKSQNEKISDSKDIENKAVSPEKLVDILNLQTKYRELSDNMRILNEKITTMSSMNKIDKTGSLEKPDETSKVLENMRKDLSSLVTYGKLFLGIGIAALLLYIINSVISLAVSITSRAG